MLVKLETTNPHYMRIFQLPFVGDTIFLLGSLIPGWVIAFGIQKLLQLSDGVQLAIYLVLATLTHGVLWWSDTKLRVLYVPLWAWLFAGFIFQMYILLTGSKIRL